jgi:hypothetical protein
MHFYASMYFYQGETADSGFFKIFLGFQGFQGFLWDFRDFVRILNPFFPRREWWI